MKVKTGKRQSVSAISKKLSSLKYRTANALNPNSRNSKFNRAKAQFISSLYKIYGIKLEWMPKFKNHSVYLIPGTSSALMMISGPENPTKSIPDVKEIISVLRQEGYKLYVVFIRGNAWPENVNTFNVYKSNSRRISEIRGLKGVFHHSDFHTFHDKIMSGYKLVKSSVNELIEMEAYKTLHSDSDGNVNYESLDLHYQLNNQLKQYI